MIFAQFIWSKELFLSLYISVLFLTRSNQIISTFIQIINYTLMHELYAILKKTNTFAPDFLGTDSRVFNCFHLSIFQKCTKVFSYFLISCIKLQIANLTCFSWSPVNQFIVKINAFDFKGHRIVSWILSLNTEFRFVFFIGFIHSLQYRCTTLS